MFETHFHDHSHNGRLGMKRLSSDKVLESESLARSLFLSRTWTVFLVMESSLKQQRTITLFPFGLIKAAERVFFSRHEMLDLDPTAHVRKLPIIETTTGKLRHQLSWPPAPKTDCMKCVLQFLYSRSPGTRHGHSGLPMTRSMCVFNALDFLKFTPFKFVLWVELTLQICYWGSRCCASAWKSGNFSVSNLSQPWVRHAPPPSVVVILIAVPHRQRADKYLPCVFRHFDLLVLENVIQLQVVKRNWRLRIIFRTVTVKALWWKLLVVAICHRSKSIQWFLI